MNGKLLRLQVQVHSPLPQNTWQGKNSQQGTVTLFTPDAFCLKPAERPSHKPSLPTPGTKVNTCSKPGTRISFHPLSPWARAGPMGWVGGPGLACPLLHALLLQTGRVEFNFQLYRGLKTPQKGTHIRSRGPPKALVRRVCKSTWWSSLSRTCSALLKSEEKMEFSFHVKRA